MPAARGSHPSTAERTPSPALKLEAEGMCLRLLRCLGVDIPPSTGLLLVSRKNGGTFGRMSTTEYTGRTCPLLVRTGLVAAFLAAGVVAGEQSACADGIVRCWGYNYYGQCDTPVDLGPCSSVAGGSLYSIALRSDGGVRCWGLNYYGQCNTPADLGPCSSVAGGSAHTIALQIDGGVRCWGANVWGQCDTPADFTARSSIAGGNAHTIALEAACPQCPSSLTGNCTVDSADLSILLGAWGSCPAGTTGCTGDINHDGQVNGADLGDLLNGWGSCPN